MKDLKQFILNIITIVSFVFYGIGIYLHVAILGEEWGNIAVDFAIQVVGPVAGVLLVMVFGALILLITFYLQKLRVTNVLLCWFWIFSLYQCAINSFLQFYGLPDEPINQFFKLLLPTFWYPMKEIVFLISSLLLTYLWVKRITQVDFKRADIVLIALASFVLVGGTVISQLFLMA